MRLLTTSILFLFLLFFSTTVYGQNTIKKNKDSIETKNTALKSNFSSRQSSLSSTTISEKSKNQKTNHSSSLSRKNYSLKRDSTHIKRKNQSNKLYLHKRSFVEDSLKRVQVISKQRHKNNRKIDFISKKQIIRNH